MRQSSPRDDVCMVTDVHMNELSPIVVVVVVVHSCSSVHSPVPQAPLDPPAHTWSVPQYMHPLFPRSFRPSVRRSVGPSVSLSFCPSSPPSLIRMGLDRSSQSGPLSPNTTKPASTHENRHSVKY